MTQWEQRLWDYIHAGFLDHGLTSPAAINRLAQEDRTAVHVHGKAVAIFPINQYLAELRTVGAEYPNVSSAKLDLTAKNAIILLRGHPRLSLLQLLGKSLHLDPMILLQHLNFPSTFRIRSLPSHPPLCITVPMISLGTYGTSSLPQRPIGQQQAHVNEATERYNADLIESDRFGNEQCRYINLHGPYFFSVEQQVTFFLYNQNPQERSWSAIIMNDSGQTSHNAPWYPELANAPQPQFFPMTRFGSCALKHLNFPGPFKDRRDMRNYFNPDACTSRAYSDLVMDAKTLALGVEDPFILVCDLLTTFSLSWIRLLSFLGSFHEMMDGDAEDKVVTLRHDKVVIDRAHLHIQNMIDIINARPYLDWPTCKTDDGKAAAKRLVDSIRADLLNLLATAEQLSKRAEQYISIEMSTISVVESKKALAQTKRAGYLTLLAYIFIPMTFVSSCFGMNLTTFTNPNPPFWKFAAVAIPFTIVMLILPLWRDALGFLRAFGRIHRW